MSEFSKQLLNIRLELNFRSALKFYDYLESRNAVSVNYTQYKRIESGRVAATADFVRQLVKGLPEHSDDLIKQYCRALFPGHDHLFDVSEIVYSKIPEKTSLLVPQDELTPRQVAIIAQSHLHYFLYLVMTMARRNLSEVELKNGLNGLTNEIITDFLKAKLIVLEGNGYRAVSIERKFPKAETQNLKSAYLLMDQWDLAIPEFFKAEKISKRSIIRRVSPRYLPIIYKFADLFIDQLTASDECDASKNSEAVSFFINVNKVKLPG